LEITGRAARGEGIEKVEHSAVVLEALAKARRDGAAIEKATEAV
jgi:hypothetical protein